MRRSLCFALFFVGSLAVYACKEDENRPPAASDTGGPNIGTGGGSSSSGSSGEGGVTDSGGAVDSGTDSGAACNTLTNDGAIVDQTAIVGDPPTTGTGGTIPDGTYELTLAQFYAGVAGIPGPTGRTYRGVLRLTNGKLERVTEMVPSQGSTALVTSSFGDLVAGGDTFTVSQSCPTTFVDEYRYSVVSNTLNIWSLITKDSFTFTLR